MQTIQEKYFDNHAILLQDFEAELEAMIQTQRDAIALFNEYQKDAADPLSRGRNQESQKAGSRSIDPSERQGNLSIDIEITDECSKVLANAIVDEWVTIATKKGKVDILEETGEDEGLIWQNFRESMGMKS